MVVLPGPTAVAAAYVASGFSCPRFYFGGFFPRKAGERRRTLEGLARLDAVLVFYESPRRVADALAAIARIFPGRDVAVCRELTKVHEEVFVGASVQVAEEFARREQAGGIRGEIVLVVDAAGAEEFQMAQDATREAARARAVELLDEGALSKKDIAARLQVEFGLKRNEAYELVHVGEA